MMKHVRIVFLYLAALLVTVFVFQMVYTSHSSGVRKLINQKLTLSKEVVEIKQEHQEVTRQLDAAIQKLNSAEAMIMDPDAVYILVLKIKQKRTFGILQPEKMIKDELNAIELPIRVDRETYYSYGEGDELAREFRVGSLLMQGSWSSWKITVDSRHIERPH